MTEKTREIRARIVARKLATVKRQVLSGDFSKSRKFLDDVKTLREAK